MNIRLHRLRLLCKASVEIVSFSPHVTFIHGELGLGKSSVPRLVDFCFGGALERTTAIQNEMIAVQLSATFGHYEVLFERAVGERTVRLTWTGPTDGVQEQASVQLPAKGDGPVVYPPDVVNLSDMLFRLLGLPIIRVRKRSNDEDSPLVRLSFRDLMRFCYLRQEDLDSAFFMLDRPILKEKSKDALNFFMGFYSEQLNLLRNKAE